MSALRGVPVASFWLTAGAFTAYTAANVIHNDFGLDPAIGPAALFMGLLLWRRRRAFLMAAALVIALPAFSFLRWSALWAPAGVPVFLNHVALLLAGVLAVLAALFALAPGRRPALQP